MLDFGEELTFGSYRIPWLIWIQLIVLLLLLALFFLLAFDDSPTASSIASSASASVSISASAAATTHLHKSRDSTSTALTNRLQNTRGGENLSIKIATSGSTRIVREEIAAEGGEASPLYFLHPCHYFKLARVAFLKCLGLDSSTSESDTPPNRKHRKRKES